MSVWTLPSRHLVSRCPSVLTVPILVSTVGIYRPCIVWNTKLHISKFFACLGTSRRIFWISLKLWPCPLELQRGFCLRTILVTANKVCVRFCSVAHFHCHGSQHVTMIGVAVRFAIDNLNELDSLQAKSVVEFCSCGHICHDSRHATVQLGVLPRDPIDTSKEVKKRPRADLRMFQLS